MDIKDLINLKGRLEQDILSLIESFEQKTGATVSKLESKDMKVVYGDKKIINIELSIKN